MKTKDKETNKNLSLKELETELHTAQQKRFKLAFKHQVAPLGNPIELRMLRRQIARLKTWISQKQQESK